MPPAKKHLHLKIFQSDSPANLEMLVNDWFHANPAEKIKQYGYLQNSPYAFYVVYEH